MQAAGGWTSPGASELFGNYVRAVTPILDAVEWVCTINEPNMIAIMHTAPPSALGWDAAAGKNGIATRHNPDRKPDQAGGAVCRPAEHVGDRRP